MATSFPSFLGSLFYYRILWKSADKWIFIYMGVTSVVLLYQTKIRQANMVLLFGVGVFLVDLSISLKRLALYSSWTST